MHITIIGSGYVGLVAGACFAQMGNNVTCLDVDSKKIESLKQGIIPIYEPGLESMVLENTARGTLAFTTDKAQAIGGAEVIFIAVGTPMGDDGSADLRFVRAVAEDIGAYMAREYVVVVDKSTVPVGTAREVRSIIESSLAKRSILARSGDEMRESSIDSEAPSGGAYLYRDKNQSCAAANLEGIALGERIASGEGASLLNLQVWISPAASSSPSTLDKKEKEILSDSRILEVKAKDSKKQGLESSQDSESKSLGESAMVADSEKLESKGRAESAKAGDSEKQGLESKKLESATDSKSQTQAFDVVSNPEFLKEGVAIKDFMSPDRVVIGTDSKRALEVMKALYAPFLLKSDRLIAMGIESAEMTKYAANAMLATKISFINEMSQICERVGANINDVRQGIGSDSRIGYSFIYPGCGYGGSCFPKDVRALEKTAKDFGYTAQILNAVQAVNEAQKMLLVEKIVRHFGENLKGLSFALWGLSFKPETDDMREASSLVLIRELVARGARIQAYDPKAYHQAEFYLQAHLDSISFEQSKYDALKDAAALVLLTEWREFRSPDFGEMKKLLKTPLIFDGRNIYQHAELESKGFTYYQIGVGTGAKNPATNK